MKTLTLVGLATLAMLAPLANATHDAGCVPTFADPATVNVIVSPLDGRVFYDEERNTGLPPVPGSGFVLADGTWIYEETNTVGNMQRGGIGLTGACFPGNDDPLPCLIIDEDPINDENCGHNPDAIII